MKKIFLFRILVPLAASLAIALGVPAHAAITDVPVTGTVTDEATGDPIEGVRIDDGRKWVYTDDAGRYTIQEPMLSGAVLSAQKTGYKTESHWITVYPGNERLPDEVKNDPNARPVVEANDNIVDFQLTATNN